MKRPLPSFTRASGARSPGAGVRLSATLGLWLLTAAGARAEGAAAGAPARTSEKEYVLTHKSSYSGSTTPRSPFWPIGWVPSAPVAAEVLVVAPTVRAEDFVVTSISLDFPPLAVINKHTYGVGDRVPVGSAGTAAAPKSGEFVTVRQIIDGTVVLDHRGTLLRCSTTAVKK